MTLKKGLTTLVFFGIGVGLFWLAMQGVEDPEALKRDMRSAQWWGIASSFVMGYLAIVSRGIRWNLLLAPMGHRPSPARSVHAVAFSYFANAFVPRSGEVARCAALNQTDDIPVDQLFGTVITERVVDFVMLFGLVGFALLTNLDAFLQLMNEAQLPATPTLAGLAVLGAAGTGACGGFPNSTVEMAFWARRLGSCKASAQAFAACLPWKRGRSFWPTRSSFGRCIF